MVSRGTASAKPAPHTQWRRVPGHLSEVIELTIGGGTKQHMENKAHQKFAGKHVTGFDTHTTPFAAVALKQLC